MTTSNYQSTRAIREGGLREEPPQASVHCGRRCDYSCAERTDHGGRCSDTKSGAGTCALRSSTGQASILAATSATDDHQFIGQADADSGDSRSLNRRDFSSVSYAGQNIQTAANWLWGWEVDVTATPGWNHTIAKGGDTASDVVNGQTQRHGLPSSSPRLDV